MAYYRILIIFRAACEAKTWYRAAVVHQARIVRERELPLYPLRRIFEDTPVGYCRPAPSARQPRIPGPKNYNTWKTNDV